MTELIPVSLIINNPKNNDYKFINFSCKTIEECYNMIVINIKNNITMIIDYPDSVDEFAVLYWNNNNVFNYSVFTNNEWKQPWTYQDIYESAIEIIHTIDLQNSLFNETNFEEEED